MARDGDRLHATTLVRTVSSADRANENQAAGNEHKDAAPVVPATYEEVIAVSAFPDVDGEAGGEGVSTCTRDGDETFARFSSYGEDVDIAAPGVCILSAWRNGKYLSLSGTSMATPHVTGATALYIPRIPTPPWPR